jgi:aminopeptidase N
MKSKLLIVILFSLATLAKAQPPDTLWQRSLKRFEQRNYNGVVEDMNSFLKMIPGFADALYNRGIARLNLGNLDEACQDLEQARSEGSTENKQFVNYLCNKDYVRDLMLKQFYKKQKVYPEYAYRPKYTRADSLRGALRPERTCFDVYFYDLRVKIIPKGKRIEGSNAIYFHVIQPSKIIQIDLFDNYKITGITWNGIPLSYKREYNALFIEFPQILIAGENQTIQIKYKGKPINAPNPPWDGGFVWKHDKNKNLWLGVACEHLGASSWWPNKDHLSDKPDSMLISLTVPSGYQAVSNGNIRQITHVGKNFDQFSWFVSYPINNYNVTFYVGKYVSFSDTLVDNKDTVRLDYNVLNYNLDLAKEYFKQTREVISFYDKAFGIYPFQRDGFGLVESPYEGMEHQSAIAYGNGYNSNEGKEYRNQKYDYIIVHEAAHEWWGNAVAASDMADIWIHEGFATYAELLFLEDRFGKDEYLFELADKSQYIFNIWPMVQNRNVNENSFASNDVYTKGAMMLHCLRCTVNNDSLFFSLIRAFNLKYRYHTVSSSDFINFVHQYTGTDYSAFFSKYLYDTRLPLLSYSYRLEDGNLILKYRWSEVDDGFIMPFAIATDKKESLRLVGTTSWQEISIPETSWFNFYNLFTGYQGCPDNAFTYYRTASE